MSSKVDSPTTRNRIRGVVFDMEGTLTLPVIDFYAMYKAILGENYATIIAQSPTGSIDILRTLQTWSPEGKRIAHEIIDRYEKHRLEIRPGLHKLYEFLESRNIRRGIITRNRQMSIDFFHKRFGREFSPALGREFRPVKPDPAPLLYICATWNVKPHEVMMVRDCLKDDVGCGKRAGAFACLFDPTGKYNSKEYGDVTFKPDYKVSTLEEIRHILKRDFEFELTKKSPLSSLLGLAL